MLTLYQACKLGGAILYKMWHVDRFQRHTNKEQSKAASRTCSGGCRHMRRGRDAASFGRWANSKAARPLNHSPRTMIPLFRSS